MRRLITFILLALGAACTPQQVEVWQDWHRQDPVAAERFVADGCAGMCDGGWSDVTTGDEIFDMPVQAWGQCAQWMDDALAAGWTEDQWGTLNWVMYEESHCDPGAYNPSGASGLLQVMPDWADDCGGSPSDLFEPWFNLQCGLHVYNVQGWSAWSVWN